MAEFTTNSTTWMQGLARREIWARAWPLILANSTVPLLGLADTAVIGRFGNLFQLGAIALGALIFSFLYWSFGFLRMGTTGFTAQAAGAGDEAEVRAVLGRALLLALGLAIAVLLLHRPLGALAFRLLDGSAAVEGIAADYFRIRIWGAPATLSLYALMGTLIGLGRSRELLWVQLLLNGLNILLDLLFAGPLGMGARGIALGTALSEWLALIFAGLLVYRILSGRRKPDDVFWDWRRLCDPARLLHTLSANSHILVRTLLLLFSFAWFTNQSARLGDAVLGANHILLQVVSFSAFFLDGYAYVAEALVGEALGARERARLVLAVRRSSELAAFTALVLCLLILIFGTSIVQALTDIPPVVAAAREALPWAALYVLLSVAAFQLDGIFIGATRTRRMRDAALLSTLGFLAAWYLLRPLGNDGLWAAFVLYVVLRAAALLLYYPELLRAAGGGLHRQE